jgi:hypothetical protein
MLYDIGKVIECAPNVKRPFDRPATRRGRLSDRNHRTSQQGVRPVAPPPLAAGDAGIIRFCA